MIDDYETTKHVNKDLLPAFDIEEEENNKITPRPTFKRSTYIDN